MPKIKAPSSFKRVGHKFYSFLEGENKTENGLS